MKKTDFIIKYQIILSIAFIIACLVLNNSATGASWVLAPGQSLALVNDQDSCSECHEDIANPPHAGISCRICHFSPEEEFSHDNLSLKDCRQCHLPHDEKAAHDIHQRVACVACHFQGITPVTDNESETKKILWQVDGEQGKVHNLVNTDDKNFCQRCHFKGNQLGAVSVVLPAKSIICMPCHAGTFSVGDTVTLVSLFVFLVGLINLISVWLSGSLGRDKETGLVAKMVCLGETLLMTVLSAKTVLIARAMIQDVIFQNRLYKQSRTRWIIHSLIFLPFVFRFSWGFIALISSLLIPEQSAAWIMLDKNHPISAFLFDLSGVLIISGVIIAALKGAMRKSGELTGLPKQDLPGLSLIGGMIITGFILEGMRIAMTGYPGGAGYAFLGYSISLVFKGFAELPDIYGYVWYIHAVLTGAFVAYIPFSPMVHIITAPVVLAVNAMSQPHDTR